MVLCAGKLCCQYQANQIQLYIYVNINNLLKSLEILKNLVIIDWQKMIYNVIIILVNGNICQTLHYIFVMMKFWYICRKHSKHTISYLLGPCTYIECDYYRGQSICWDRILNTLTSKKGLLLTLLMFVQYVKLF